MAARAGSQGANSAPEMASSTKLRVGSQLPTKSSWNPIWMTSARRVVARDQLPEETHGTPEQHSRCAPRKPSSWDGGGDKTSPPPQSGESALAKHLFAGAAWTWEGHKLHAQPSLHVCGVPKNLNLSGLDLGSVCNPGSALDSSQQSNLEAEQCRPGKHTHSEWGQSQCSPDTVNLPTQASDVCSVPASLQHY